MDKPEADVNKIKLQLLEQEVVAEEFGGDIISAEVSAKTGTGMPALFEAIALQVRPPPAAAAA